MDLSTFPNEIIDLIKQFYWKSIKNDVNKSIENLVRKDKFRIYSDTKYNSGLNVKIYFELNNMQSKVPYIIMDYYIVNTKVSSYKYTLISFDYMSDQNDIYNMLSDDLYPMTILYDYYNDILYDIVEIIPFILDNLRYYLKFI